MKEKKNETLISIYNNDGHSIEESVYHLPAVDSLTTNSLFGRNSRKSLPPNIVCYEKI